MQLNTDNPELLILNTDIINIEVLGGIRLNDLSRLRATLKLSNQTNPVYPLRYTVDLYNQDALEKLIRRTAEHFDAEVSQTRNTFMQLIEELERYRVDKNTEYHTPRKKKVELTAEEEKQAVKYLKQKNLLQKINEDIGGVGVINENTNRLLMYLAFTSRKLNNPLHIITLGQSGTGKSHLQTKVSELMPPEETIHITALSKNSLYYFEPSELNHSLVAIEDLDGATEEALYAIRELQSRKQLTKTIAQKDARGALKTETITLKAITAIAGTTTKENTYTDNANRSIIIYIDNSKEQDEAIISYQKRLASGEVDNTRQDTIKYTHQNVQRTLKPIKVINPYAKELSLPESIYSPRRTMSIYLSLIEVITFINQYQRPIKTTETKEKYIETTKEDISWANHLLKEVMLQKSDDVSQPTRAFLNALKSHLKAKKEFTATEVRKAFRIPPTTLKRYLKELQNTGRLITKGNRYTGYEYKLIDDEYAEIQNEITAFVNG